MPRVSVKVLPGVRAYGGGCGGGAVAVMIGFVVVVGVVYIAGLGLLSLLGHPLGLTPSWHEVLHRNRDWMSAHYPYVVVRYLLTGVLLIAILLLVGSVFAGQGREGSSESANRAAPQPDATSEPADGRRWVPVISSRCPNCGAEDERPGGVFLCPTCGTQIPPEAHTATGQSVLER